MTADQAPDPARPDAVQVPQVVAWAAYEGENLQAAVIHEHGVKAGWGWTVVPLVTEPDALAYAEALAGQRVREERAAVVAWLRRDADGWRDMREHARAGAVDGALDAIERGDHLDPS